MGVILWVSDGEFLIFHLMSFCSCTDQLSVNIYQNLWVENSFILIIHVLFFHKKTKLIPSSFQITRSVDVSVIVKYYHHFQERSLLVELQWHAMYQSIPRTNIPRQIPGKRFRGSQMPFPRTKWFCKSTATGAK